MKQQTKKFKICGMNYKLKIVNCKDESLAIGDSYRCGVCWKVEETIYIADNLSEEIFKRVLLHELTHACVYGSGMSQVEWREENVCDFLETHFEEIETIYWKLIDELFN